MKPLVILNVIGSWAAELAQISALTLSAHAAPTGPVDWPAITTSAKPWAYWHWMGSAVDATNLSREIRRYADAGLGGMHIIPIYGAKGWEDRYLPYLSPSWMQALRVSVAEARRLGMDVDMTLGTGWNFGGPNITRDLSCLRVQSSRVDIGVGQLPGAVTNQASLLALVAEAADGTLLDLTDRVREDGRVDWWPERSGWRLHVVRTKSGEPMVKRAAPGGEGPMLNPFHRPAMERYLDRFTDAFRAYGDAKPRAVYHDSYEYRATAWAPDLPAEFAQRRGYRLESHRADLFGPATNDLARRVRCDYRETLSDLVLEAMTQPWAAWAKHHGFLTRNQAHGSPGNLLDLYAAADIPETEMFNKDRDILLSKFASSAAHVAGRPLVAAETGTWVAEHFTETLADLKRNVDDLFLAGVNHVFYHGTCYSPDEAGWPGWLFYAATQVNPRNSIWRDLPALNAYVARCQSVLQAGRPDSDFLVYWPIHDLWYDQQSLVEELTVHHRDWLDGQPVGPLARSLWRQGYAFDFVSDRQLAAAQTVGKDLVLPGGRYRALLVPPSRRMPVHTLRTLLELVRRGATVLFADEVPREVPGFGNMEERQHELQTLIASLRLLPLDDAPLRQARIGRGRVLVGPARTALELTGISRETLMDRESLAYVRRAWSGGTHYLVVNQGAEDFEGWLPLASRAAAVAVLDPMTGQTGLAATRSSRQGRKEVYLRLLPHQSIILRALVRTPRSAPAWTYVRPAGPAQELTGPWRVAFTAGGPDLPAPFTADRLGSWTQSGDLSTQRFAGSARYTIEFDVAHPAVAYELDLGGVAQSARVRLNGRDRSTMILPPFRLRLSDLSPRGNRLEIEVTSTAANRIRDLDLRGVPWKTFHDITFVNINYRPFDASTWPLHDAGLLGPVILEPVKPFTPH